MNKLTIEEKREKIKKMIHLVNSLDIEEIKEEVHFKGTIKRDQDIEKFLSALDNNYELFKKKSGSSQQLWKAISIFYWIRSWKNSFYLLFISIITRLLETK